MTVGENIRRIRKEKGWTQSQLAHELNISQQMIGQYENNIQPHRIDTIEKIARALDVSVLDLIGHGINASPNCDQSFAPIISYIQDLGYTVIEEQSDSKSNSLGTFYKITGNKISITLSSDELIQLQNSSSDLVHSFFWRIQQHK